MKAIARYPFQGNPAHAQISFPVGAQLTVKSQSNKDGWVWGTFGNQKGWLPATYVELLPETRSSNVNAYSPPPKQQQPLQYPQSVKTEAPSSPRLRSRVLDVPQGMSASIGFSDQTVTSKHISHDNALPPLTSVSFDSQFQDAVVSVMGDNESVNVFREQFARETLPIDSQADGNDDFPLMGGVPGSLFDAPKPALVEEETHFEQEQLPEEELKPVDIYRHAAPTKKRWNHKAEYSHEISVQITKKAQPVTPSYNTSNTKVAPAQVTPEDFWKAHPGRGGMITPSERQAYEVDHAFQGLDDSAKIEIVAEKKKQKFHMPTGLKKTWKKAKEGIMHMH